MSIVSHRVAKGELEVIDSNGRVYRITSADLVSAYTADRTADTTARKVAAVDAARVSAVSKVGPVESPLTDPDIRWTIAFDEKTGEISAASFEVLSTLGPAQVVKG